MDIKKICIFIVFALITYSPYSYLFFFSSMDFQILCFYIKYILWKKVFYLKKGFEIKRKSIFIMEKGFKTKRKSFFTMEKGILLLKKDLK